MKKLSLVVILLFCVTILSAQEDKKFHLDSPDKKIRLTVKASEKLEWMVKLGDKMILEPSSIAMKLEGGEVLGKNLKGISSKIETVKTFITPLNYKKKLVEDHYNQLTLSFKGKWGVIFRAYNEGLAYRFFTKRKKDITILGEEATFNFPTDEMVYIPYVSTSSWKDAYQNSFENSYQHIRLSEIDKDTLAFAPVLVAFSDGIRAAITEADLEDYPGMFLKSGEKSFSLSGEFAPYPLEELEAGPTNFHYVVERRAAYIAKTYGNRHFPWRVIILSEEDKDLLNNDMVYRLASPNRIEDVSWIKPGKVAWDWWNDWNISGVDFVAGVNTETYKYYTDFAAEYNLEYILLDEGWADPKDIMQIVPAIDLPEIIAYGKDKGVGVWLWAGWHNLNKNMDEALARYSKMGIKGLKVDFMDRDDQKMVNFYYDLAKKAAEHKIMIDFHGAFKPTGLQRTYPNVLNFEGVKGLEYAKWSNPDFPENNTTIPFIRMLAGPMDYTPGAMTNANKKNFRAVHSAPMSQGTRAHQLALFILYEAPLNMLADNPTSYKREPESTRFIASVPTIFDETIALDGQIAKFAAIARRKQDTWYLGAITNWDNRELELDLSFLPAGNYEAEVFSDGMNAHRDGSDYKREIIMVDSKEKLKINMAKGGGWAARISPKM